MESLNNFFNILKEDFINGYLENVPLNEDNFYTPTKEGDHYAVHVSNLPLDEYFEQEIYDTEYQYDNVKRYLFPNMSRDEYVKRANDFANDTNVGDSHTNLNYYVSGEVSGYGSANTFGYQVDTYNVFSGAGVPETKDLPVYVKFRRPKKFPGVSEEQMKKLMHKLEYVAYQILEDDNKYGKKGERKIISYGFVTPNTSPQLRIPALGELPESERSSYEVPKEYQEIQNEKEAEKERLNNREVEYYYLDLDELIPTVKKGVTIVGEISNLFLKVVDNKLGVHFKIIDTNKLSRTIHPQSIYLKKHPKLYDDINDLERRYSVDLGGKNYQKAKNLIESSLYIYEKSNNYKMDEKTKLEFIPLVIRLIGVSKILDLNFETTMINILEDNEWFFNKSVDKFKDELSTKYKGNYDKYIAQLSESLKIKNISTKLDALYYLNRNKVD